MEFKVGETYPTRDGKSARILSTEGPKTRRIVAIYAEDDYVRCLNEEGKVFSLGTSQYDLLQKRRVTYKVYNALGGLMCEYSSKRDADLYSVSHAGCEIVTFREVYPWEK